ncbi:MAG: DUF3857 domain-containing protein [Bacteroidales bacterium]
MRMLIFILFVASSLLINPLSAQSPFEFGSITASEMDLEYYREKYPGEPAVVIGDVADCRFGYATKKGFQFNLNREIRIMVLNEAGLEYGNFSIPYYESDGGQEEISRFRAHVYNLDGNKVNRTRIREREGFTQDRQNNWKELSFAFPEVKVGSVIEVRYTIISDFLFHLRDWRFQREIPVLHSEYNLNLPSFFVYYGRYSGLFDLDIREQEDSSDNWRISRKVQTIMGEIDGDVLSVRARSTIFRWAAFDVPPMRPEPFTDNIRNYQARLFFEFTREQWPDEEPDHFTTSWKSVENYLSEHENFGSFLKESSSALWSLLPESLPQSPEEKLWTALEAIHKNVRWNNDASFLADNSPKEVLSMGTGNSAEVNLLLVAILRIIGMESYPVAVSTVNNGSLFSDSPTITQWNYVVALVKMPDGKDVLLDATVPEPIPGYLPQRAINGNGRAIDPDLNDWVNLESSIDFLEQNHYNLSLNEDGDLSGSFEMQIGSFGKYKLVQELAMLGEERFWDQLINHSNVQLSNEVIQYDIKDDRPIILKADIFIPSYASKIGNELIIPALLFETSEENLFQSEERQYPVFFNNTLNSVTIINLDLPDNMTVNYKPENKSRKWGRFSYELMAEETETGLKIIWLNHRQIRTIPSRNYSGFRTYYNRMIDDNLENIIVKVE